MKIVQTFWTGPGGGAEKPGLGMQGGWLSAEYHWMSWALSCLQLIRLHGQVELVTDRRGKEILVDTLQLPFTTVTTALEGKLDDCPAGLWAMAKIYSYSIQQEPFIHLDSDLFLWKALGPEVLNADLVSQNLEVDLYFYRDILAEIKQHFAYIPEVLAPVADAGHVYASNAGMLGGRHLPFIRAYCQEAFTFIGNNRPHLEKVSSFGLNFLVEQCLFHYMARGQHVPVTYFMPDPVDHPLFQEYVRFTDVPGVAMIHTVGAFKRQGFICDQLARRLRRESPAHYYRIIGLCRENKLTLRHKVYHTVPFSLPRFYPDHYRLMLRGGGLPGPGDAGSGNAPAGGLLREPDFTADFARTRAAMDLFDQAPAAGAAADVEGFLAAAPEGENKDRLAEIFGLERQKATMCDDFRDPALNWARYAADLLRYQDTERLFLRPGEELLELPITPHETMRYIPLEWHWLGEPGEETKAVVERTFAAERAVYAVALVPDVLQLTVQEMYQDALDVLIIEACRSPKTIRQVMHALEEYFEPDQLKDAYDDYKRLLLDSVKRLMYAGIIAKAGGIA